jgi:hypothetical protein
MRAAGSRLLFVLALGAAPGCAAGDEGPVTPEPVARAIVLELFAGNPRPLREALDHDSPSWFFPGYLEDLARRADADDYYLVGTPRRDGRTVVYEFRSVVRKPRSMGTVEGTVTVELGSEDGYAIRNFVLSPEYVEITLNPGSTVDDG